MSFEDLNYHRERERQCRDLAAAASDPDVRRRHQELADLHASRFADFQSAPPATGFGRESGLSLA